MGPGGDFQNLQEERIFNKLWTISFADHKPLKILKSQIQEETNTKSIKPLDCYIKPSEIGFYTELKRFLIGLERNPIMIVLKTRLRKRSLSWIENEKETEKLVLSYFSLFGYL